MPKKKVLSFTEFREAKERGSIQELKELFECSEYVESEKCFEALEFLGRDSHEVLIVKCESKRQESLLEFLTKGKFEYCELDSNSTQVSYLVSKIELPFID